MHPNKNINCSKKSTSCAETSAPVQTLLEHKSRRTEHGNAKPQNHTPIAYSPDHASPDAPPIIRRCGTQDPNPAAAQIRRRLRQK